MLCDHKHVMVERYEYMLKKQLTYDIKNVFFS